MIFRRLLTPSCIAFGMVATGRVTPSIRARTTCSHAAPAVAQVVHGVGPGGVGADLVRVDPHAADRRLQRQLDRTARAEGMATLRMDGWLKVLDGVTSIEEVLRVVV